MNVKFDFQEGTGLDSAHHWNIKQANGNYEWEQWHLKRAREARRKGDLYSARDHERRAITYHDKGNEYRNAAARSTK